MSAKIAQKKQPNHDGGTAHSTHSKAMRIVKDWLREPEEFVDCF